MKLIDISEIVIGLVLDHKIPAEHISPMMFDSSYQSAAKILTQNSEEAVILDKIGIHAMMACKTAASSVDHTIDWLAQLELASNRERAADVLDQQAKRLRNGQECDAGKVLAVVQDDYKSAKYITMDKVVASKGTWVKTGYKPIDSYMGGLPDAGLTIMAGPPGTGKTSLQLKILSSIVKSGTKKILDYTFEMTNKQIKNRLQELNSLPKEMEDRFISCEEVMDARQAYAEATRIASKEDLACISFDFADLMSMEEDTEQAVGMIYRTLATLAKRTGVPVLLLSQLNRNYVGGIPKITNIRWSGLAEAMASMILLLYNPNQIWADQGKDDRLPAIDGRGYIIVGKSRFGFKEGGVGAMQVDWIGENGWGDTPIGWIPLGH